MKKRVMLIGSVGAGKSSLTKALLEAEGPATKTQALTYVDWIIDTPGEYSENPLFYRSLMATSLEAKLLMIVQDATRERNFFPPGFAGGFPIKAVGVVTKTDHPQANPERAERLLRQAIPGAEIWHTSAHAGTGIDALRARLLDLLK